MSSGNEALSKLVVISMLRGICVMAEVSVRNCPYVGADLTFLKTLNAFLNLTYRYVLLFSNFCVVNCNLFVSSPCLKLIRI